MYGILIKRRKKLEAHQKKFLLSQSFGPFHIIIIIIIGMSVC